MNNSSRCRLSNVSIIIHKNFGIVYQESIQVQGWHIAAMGDFNRTKILKPLILQNTTPFCF